MVKILFLILLNLLASYFLVAQSKRDSISQTINYLKNDSNFINFEENYYLLDSALDGLVKEIFASRFTSDTLLIRTIDSVKYLISMYDTLIRTDFKFRWISKNNFEVSSEYNGFLKSLLYSNIYGIERVDSIVSNECIDLYWDVFRFVNYEYLDSTFNKLNDCEKEKYFLHSLSFADFNKFLTLISNNISKIRICDKNYLLVFNRLKENRDPNSQLLLINESNYFNTHLDTSNFVKKYIYHRVIRDEPTEDELRRKELDDKDYAEQRIKLDEIDRKAMEEREKPIVIDFNTLSDQDKLYYMVYSDTTLWENGYPTINNGDDAMRFDTFSNAYLINLIRNYNYSEVYDSLRSSEDFSRNTSVVHLRKIFQILGDRNTFGSYTPSSQDTGILYAWVDKYYDEVLHSNYPAMQDEAADQILRLWRLVYPRWVGWLKNENLMERALIKQRIIYMLNEELILDLIARGDAVYNPESPKEAHILANPLLDVFYGVVIPEHLKSARRPSWSAMDAQHWVDDYIVPALKRWKYFGF
ncbi:MAG: hypothetical protein JNK69_08090 [Saprospiraceae bacterium]|nr:hypothetical protein [Saprospiraceae bacterium]MCC6843397.1 hypothetical protein [Saprospiraceae bacterium]HRG32626.1 hypothetical protein [Saprospiraceae bacterium]